MDSFLKSLVDKLPEWSFHAFAFVLIVAAAFYFYRSFFLQKKFNDLISDVLKRDDRIKDFHEKIDHLKVENQMFKAKSSQFYSVITSIKQYIDALNELRAINHPPDLAISKVNQLLQRLVEALAFNIKAISGEQHRCGIWNVSDVSQNQLLLVCASSGFPSHYQGWRTLDIDRSIAGRCFRKKEVINCPDVTKDSDWTPSDYQKRKYNALICVPLSDWGVLTIDAIEPMGEECVEIGELYSSVICGLLIELYWAMARRHEEDKGAS